MFKKLVSNLPFSPSLVAQLGFYARRLKKEQWLRRLGLIVTVFALIIQSFAVFSPPESANAANPSDVLSGGCANKACFLSAWDTNRQGFRDFMAFMGLTRAELDGGTYTLTYASTWNYTFGRMSATYRVGNVYVPASGTTFYYGPLQWSGRDYALVGHSSKLGDFAVMGPCGNLLLKKIPPAPTPPPAPAASCTSLTADPTSGITDYTTFTFKLQGNATNGAQWSGYGYNWSGAASGSSGTKPLAAGGGSTNFSTKFGKAGTYNVKGYFDTTNAGTNLTSAACTKNISVTARNANSTLTKTVDKATAKPGDTLNYTLAFQNTGNIPLTNVVIKDTLPAHLTLSSAVTTTPATGVSGNLFTSGGLTIASVAPGATVTIKFAAKVDISGNLNCGVTNLKNTASATANEKPTAITASTDTTVTVSCDYSYNLVKTVDKATANPGDKLQYTLAVTNTGNRGLTNVVVKDTLPPNVTLDGEVTTDLPAKATSGNLFKDGLIIPNLAAGATAKITFSVKIAAASAFDCGDNQLLNTATVTAKEQTAESDTSDNSAVTTVTHTCNCSDPTFYQNNVAACTSRKIAVNHTQGGVDATTVNANGGDIINYTLTIVNPKDTEETINIEDPLADTLEYAGLTDQGGGTFDSTTKILHWDNVVIAPGGSVTRTFTVTVKNPIPAMPRGLSLPTSFDCIMDNVADTGVGSSNRTNTVSIPVNCPPQKIVEQVVTQLPATGAGTNIIVGGVIIAIVVFFYARSKQLGKEVRLVRREFNAGTL